MTPWLIFGTGGKGVGLLTVLLALEASQPVITLVRKEEAAQFLRAKGATVISTIGEHRTTWLIGRLSTVQITHGTDDLSGLW